MVVPKFSYLNGLALQIAAFIFIITQHNLYGGTLLFYIGDFQMLLSIRFSRLKKDKHFTLLDLGIWNIYYILHLIIFLNLILGLKFALIPEFFIVIIFLMLIYAGLRLLAPLNNLNRAKYIPIYFNIMFIIILITLNVVPFLSLSAIFAGLVKAFLLQLIFLVFATMILSFILARNLLKGVDEIKCLGCIFLLLMFLGGALIFSSTFLYLAMFLEFSWAALMSLLILIWLLIVNYTALAGGNLKKSEKQAEGILFALLFYFLILVLIFTIIITITAFV